MSSLTRSERHALRRIEASKTPGCAQVAQYLERKGLIARHADGTVVTTPKGRSALQLSAQTKG